MRCIAIAHQITSAPRLALQSGLSFGALDANLDWNVFWAPTPAETIFECIWWCWACGYAWSVERGPSHHCLAGSEHPEWEFTKKYAAAHKRLFHDVGCLFLHAIQNIAHVHCFKLVSQLSVSVPIHSKYFITLSTVSYQFLWCIPLIPITLTSVTLAHHVFLVFRHACHGPAMQHHHKSHSFPSYPLPAPASMSYHVK